MGMPVIYLITNRINGKRYIGLTQYSSKQRFAAHRRNAGYGLKTSLYAAIRKYGIENFDLQDVACCLSVDTSVSVERDIIKAERPEYNQTNGGEFTVGKRVPRDVVDRIIAANTGKKRTAAQNAEMSRIKKAAYADPVFRKKIGDTWKIARSKVDRAKQRAAASKASKGRIWSAESRAKLSASSRLREERNKIQVECTTLSTVFDSFTEAAELLGLSSGNVCRVARDGGTLASLKFKICAEQRT
jgi:group I intron endonuclease